MITNREEPPMRIVTSKVTGVSFEPPPPPSVNTTWPEFGVPPHYSPPFSEASEVGKSTPHVVHLPTFLEIQLPLVVHTMAPRPVDDHHYAYYDVGSNNDDQEEKEELIENKYQTLEKRVKAMEGNNIFGATTMDMCLVMNLVIPTKFKTTDIKKYKSHTSPKSHLVMYFWNLASHTKNDKLLIQCFQDSLSGASLKWYMSLEQSRIQSLQDLADAFIHQYKYNLDM